MSLHKPIDPSTPTESGSSAPRSLADVPAGTLVRVVRLDELPPGWRERFLAHGLASGCQVRVLQHRPVTVIQIDNTELAFERELARAIMVEG